MRDVFTHHTSVVYAIICVNVVVTWRWRTSPRSLFVSRYVSARLLPVDVEIIVITIVFQTVHSVHSLRAVASRRARATRRPGRSHPFARFHPTFHPIVVRMLRAHGGNHRRVRRRVRDQRPPRRALPIRTHSLHPHYHPNVTSNILFVRDVTRSNRANYALDRPSRRDSLPLVFARSGATRDGETLSGDSFSAQSQAQRGVLITLPRFLLHCRRHSICPNSSFSRKRGGKERRRRRRLKQHVRGHVSVSPERRLFEQVSNQNALFLRRWRRRARLMIMMMIVVRCSSSSASAIGCCSSRRRSLRRRRRKFHLSLFDFKFSGREIREKVKIF